MDSGSERRSTQGAGTGKTNTHLVDMTAAVTDFSFFKDDSHNLPNPPTRLALRSFCNSPKKENERVGVGNICIYVILQLRLILLGRATCYQNASD